MLAEIQQGLLKRLRSTPEIDAIAAVDAFDDSVREYGRAVPSGQILVGYKRGVFEPQAGMEPIALKATLTWELVIQVKDLRNNSAAYPLLDVCRRALTGHRLPIVSSQPIAPVTEGFVDGRDNLWVYSQTYEVKVQITEAAAIAEPPTQIPDGIPIRLQHGLWRSLIDPTPPPFAPSQWVRDQQIPLGAPTDAR